MNRDMPEIAIAERLTTDEKSRLIERACEIDQSLQGAEVADVLDIFSNGDTMIKETERFYERHIDLPGEPGPERGMAVIAAAILQPDDMLPLVTRLVTPANPTSPKVTIIQESHLEAAERILKRVGWIDQATPELKAAVASAHALLAIADEVTEIRRLLDPPVDAEVVEDDNLVRGQHHPRTGEFVPDPDVLDEVPGQTDSGAWEDLGKTADLAFAQGHSVGYPGDATSHKIRNAATKEEVFVTKDAWERYLESLA